MAAGTWNKLAIVSAVLGILLILGGPLYKTLVDGKWPYLDPASNVVLASKIGEGMMEGGAVIGIGGSCVFTWLAWRRRHRSTYSPK